MICPRCQCTDYYKLAGRKFVRCARCRCDFSETSGTVWKSSKLAPEVRTVVIDMLDQGKNRHAISVATGLQYKTVQLIAERLHEERLPAIIEPKKEYCGPYLLALPAPAWYGSYHPIVPPFRIFVSDHGIRILDGFYKELREAEEKLWGMTMAVGEMAEVVDATDEWIVRILSTIDASHFHSP